MMIRKGEGMRNQTLFDSEHQLRRTRVCQKFLLDFLSDVNDDNDGSKKALDVACGVGILAKTLSDAGLEVTAIDARPQNIAEAKRRFPDIEFHVSNVEADSLRQFGQFHIVICFGLLYHLENPFHVVRGLFESTAHFLLIESQIAHGDAPSAILMNEPEGEDKALKGIAFVPTESCLVKMCYQAGFRQVYIPNTKYSLDNDYFRDTIFRRKQRTVLVAAKDPQPLSENLVAVSEPHKTRPDLWARVPVRVVRFVRRVWSN